ncbi:histone acetyltransferase complex component [Chlorella sorokiniana]|uniref:Histone acetyltransferase complex component n=1 Tax=Chlorella sorokiniana TaxID=3076 RepID=A0A2P6TPT4_CHLSO|nr:histone acetyltransferase complex component [Chlorella sorokiniana]|eukprot:PRW56050.1 histone acetyltransferase complex component [Chlorella sorokiniana]
MGAPGGTVASSRNKRRRDDAATGAGKAGTGKSGNEGLYHCDYCHKDLSSTLRIKCAVCKDFDLCLECFSVGVELNVAGHKSSHAYKVVQSLGFPLYHPGWRADEELLLLEGIEIYGLGNWPKVSEHVGKSLEEVRGHFLATYIEHEGAPLPRRELAMQGVDIEKLVQEYRRTGRDALVAAGVGPGAAVARPAAAAAAAARPRKRGRPPKSRGYKEEDETETEEEPDETPTEEDTTMVYGEDMEVEVKTEEGEEATQMTEATGGTATAAASEGIKVEEGEEQQAPVSPTARKRHAEAAGGGGGKGKAAAAAAAAAAHITQGTFALRPAAPAADGLATPMLKTPGAAGEKAPGTAKIPAATEAQQTGYNIKRNEFEPEWDFEAETIISELADFKDDDPEEESRQKDRLIQIYNRRLDERERRRQFVLDRGLLNVKRQQAIDKRRSAAEREVHGSLRVLARHLPQEQYEALAEGLAEQYEALAEGLAVEQKLRARIAELQEYRSQGLRTFEQVDEYEALHEARRKKEAQSAVQSLAIRNKIGKVGVDEGALAEALVETIDAAHAAATLAQQHSQLPDGRGHTGLGPWRGKRGVLLDITSLPDSEPLSRQERNLCATERYLPAQYLAIKAAALKLQEARGRLPRQDFLRLPFQVDPGRMQRLHDFFVQQGWIVPGTGSGKQQQQDQQQWGLSPG